MDNAEINLARRWALLTQNDSRLAAMVDGWERLTESMKEAITSIVRAAASQQG